MGNKLYFASIGIAFSFVSYQMKKWMDFEPQVTRYSIFDTRWRGQENLRIALVSDFHGGSELWSGQALANVVRRERVDLVCVTGDHFDPDRYGVEAFGFLEEIARFRPVYFVTGNNEEKLPIDTVLKIIRRYGVHVLNNETCQVRVKNAVVDILGLRDYGAFSSKERWHWAVQQRMKKASTDNHFHLVLCHRPEMTVLFNQLDAHLILAGHAHGGQWRIGKHQGVFAPGQGILPKYTKGIYKIGKKERTNLIVSTGFEVGNKIPRIHNKPELVIIDIKGCQ